MRLELAAGIDGVFSVVKVGVASAFFRSAGRPVLDHCVDTFFAPAVAHTVGGLEAFHIGAGHIGIEVGIFAEGAVEAVPAGFGGQVDLRAEGRGDTQGPVFLGSGDAEAADKRGIERGRKAQR